MIQHLFARFAVPDLASPGPCRAITLAGTYHRDESAHPGIGGLFLNEEAIFDKSS
jgi:hypothetical protein